MKIHRKLMLLVGAGMLLIMAITIFSIQYISSAFSTTAAEMKLISTESHRIWVIERKIDEILRAVQNFAGTGERKYIVDYQNAFGQVSNALKSTLKSEHGQDELALLATLSTDLEMTQKKAERIFFLPSPVSGQRMLAGNLLYELNSLHSWMERDISRYQELNWAQTDMIHEELRMNAVKVNYIFLLVLLTSLGALFAFVVYVHRRISVPLNELWEGTEEISRGNLDFQMKVHGEEDIARLSQRFNDMAQKLRASYTELEQRLSERTHELASLDAVALTLSHAGSLKDLLDKSLLRILDSLEKIEPRGGVFLCDPGGEVLHLVAHQGLSPEFVHQESEIKMGECLCGMVARTGEMIFTGHDCEDARHTRPRAPEHAHIIIPIKSRGIVLGVIFLYPRQDFKIKPSDVQMLDAIGAQLGLAVENFRFYAEEKESSEKYWDLFENASDILFTMDGSGKLNATNRAAEDFIGYSKMELFGKSVLDFLTLDGAAAARRMFSAPAAGQWTEFEVVKRDGSRALIEVTVRKLSGNQKPSGFQASARDVTEQTRLREMLLEAERLGAIGQVGVAVRHEINNPLTTVIGNIELLIERYADRDSQLTGRLETILQNALRIAEIVKQLQAIKKDKVVEYLKGVSMTDLKQK